MIRIGLTGSIGMGKSTTAALFAAEGIPVNDADAVVHDLYRDEAVAPIEAAFPGVTAEAVFLDTQRAAGRTMVVLDIPLLFESGAADRVDVVVVVSCDPQIQRQRVLARPGMSEDKFNLILSRQVPDADKRARADFIIDTGHGIEAARSRVRDIIATVQAGIKTGQWSAKNA
jgi:dephospho-CoA kinase